VSGSNDTFELLNMHNNMGNGIFMGTTTGGGNLILNCDSHDNYDPTTTQGDGQNADGFGVHYQPAAPPRSSGAADHGGTRTMAMI